MVKLVQYYMIKLVLQSSITKTIISHMLTAVNCFVMKMHVYKWSEQILRLDQGHIDVLLYVEGL